MREFTHTATQISDSTVSSLYSATLKRAYMLWVSPMRSEEQQNFSARIRSRKEKELAV
jgi:hypothetical protein